MIKNELQKFLEQNKAYKMTDKEIENLMKPLNVKTIFEDDLICFMYDVKADWSNPVVQNCRGIILYRDNFSIACYPFDKFNNYTSYFADNIDWDSAIAQEKLDGQIMKLWFNRLINKWTLSTQSSIYAEKSQTIRGINREELFNQAESKLDYNKLNQNKTYIFELTSPLSPVIIKYNKTDIWHIGTRDNITQQEENVDIGIQKPKTYKINSLEEAVELANKLCTQSDRHEGLVIVDKNYHRIKVKNDFYGMCKYMLKTTNADNKSILSFIDKHHSELDSICDYVPSVTATIRYYQWQEAEARANIVKLLKQCRNIKQRATNKAKFAFKVKNLNNKYENFAFDYYEFEGLAEEYIETIPAEKLANYILPYNKAIEYISTAEFKVEEE